MKILLVNYRYFISGGPERYLFNLTDLLESRGHEVIPFSIAYDRNKPSEYEQYFAAPLSGADEVLFREHSRNATSYAKTLERTFYSPEVYQRLSALLDATRPDAALVLHYLRKLSPSVLKCLSDRGVPFAVRLSDFAMVCPNAHLIRNATPCELCIGGGLRHSVRYRCVQGSRAASAVNYVATRFHQAAGYYNLIKRFVVPSRFTREKMIAAGWPAERLAHIRTFVQLPARRGAPTPGPTPTIAFVGRLDPTKGVDTLLAATRILHARADAPAFTVRIAGTGPPEYRAHLEAVVTQNRLPVAFDGLIEPDAVGPFLAAARCGVVPSLWYENSPNAALESMAEGTPVVCSSHGCFPEVVQHRSTGVLFPPGDAGALAQALYELLVDPALARRLGLGAQRFVQHTHSPDGHYHQLMNTLVGLIRASRTSGRGRR